MQLQNKSTAPSVRSVRIANIQVPANKKVYVGLQYIFGIGEVTALQICRNLEINKDKRVYELSDDELIRLRNHITQEYTIESELRRSINEDIRRKIDTNSYSGQRHRNNLPVRGQNTHSNARTRRSRSRPIANKKKAAK